ncbi:MAG: helix-turn-helix domain-containing protein [Thermanaeromonas sp.]|uniref:helix-turn-helix domain-containing protein n=1 Tax=Thermanaeromonas sp. TaxID=2003697 RepID=UPI00243D9DC3|nr:helix-turn-helix transcriptional regulator [Thermanaeromonas sp.]MCG0277335.1 helix-turn-helix domain-containing protein [Thermanaeromonas sp.]
MLGQRLRFYRQRRHLTLKDVEEMTGLHATTISGYERGIRKPSYDVLRLLAEVYEVPVAYLLLDEKELSEVIPKEVTETVDLLTKRPDIAEFIQEIKHFPQPLVRQLHDVIRGIRSLQKPKE